MRRPVIAGNWKMNMTASETRVLLGQLKASLAAAGDVEVIVCPPFTSLAEACSQLRGTAIAVGGQNMHWEEKGAFTGEVSAAMLKDLGCTCVILGHSERRILFGEDDTMVNKKVHAALAAGLIPILCIGETLEQREQGVTQAVCRRQLEGALAGLTAGAAARLIIAYEPVWAIGTGRTATPQDAQSVIGYVRAWLREAYGDTADTVRILYGGSVKASNIDGLMAQPDIDGALVGGASLDAGEFTRIVRFEVQDR